MRPEVLIIAGEASADLHAAELLKQLQRLHPEMKAFGIGGEHLRQQGMEILYPASDLSVVGISDWLDKAKDVVGIYRGIAAQVKSRRPTAAVLLDLPDFNLRLAKKLKAQGVPVVYYISPQVWAWRKYRVSTIKRVIDKMLVVFPFEKEFYDRKGVACEFVGHPLLDTLPARASYRGGNEIRSAPRIAVLPGSRKSEVRYHSDVLRSVVNGLRLKYPKAEFQIPIANTLDRASIEKAFFAANVTFTDDSRASLEWSDLAMVASGTATLETALIGTPFLLFYRVSPSSAWIFKHLVRYRGLIGMPNLLLKREVAREFFQENATAENLIDEVVKLIENDSYRENQATVLKSCRDGLGSEGASRRAAFFVHQLLPRTPTAVIHETVPTLLGLDHVTVPT